MQTNQHSARHRAALKMPGAGVEPACRGLGNRRLSYRPRGPVTRSPHLETARLACRSARQRRISPGGGSPRSGEGDQRSPTRGCRTGIAPASADSQSAPITRRVTTPNDHSISSSPENGAPCGPVGASAEFRLGEARCGAPRGTRSPQQRWAVVGSHHALPFFRRTLPCG